MEPFVIQRSTLPFRGENPNFQEQLQNFEVAASKFNIDRFSTSITSKGLSENFKKNSWDNVIFSTLKVVFTHRYSWKNFDSLLLPAQIEQDTIIENQSFTVCNARCILL